MKWVPGTPGALVVASKLSPQWLFSFQKIEPHPWKEAIKFLFFFLQKKFFLKD